MARILQSLAGVFLRGIITVVPLLAVYLTGKYIYDVVDSYRSYRIFDSAWITLGITLLAVFMIGLATRWILLRPLFSVFEDILSRTPLVKFVYSSIKDLMEAFVGDKRRFSHPVRLDLSDDGSLQRFGFVTSDALTVLGDEFEGKVTVYIPFSYSFSGQMFIVPANRVESLNDVDSAELMKFILAGGVTEINDVKKRKRKKDEEEANRD